MNIWSDLESKGKVELAAGEQATKSFLARNKAHLIAYPVTYAIGLVSHWILGKLL